MRPEVVGLHVARNAVNGIAADWDGSAARPPSAAGGLLQRVRSRLDRGGIGEAVIARQQDNADLVRRLAERGARAQATWAVDGLLGLLTKVVGLT